MNPGLENANDTYSSHEVATLNRINDLDTKLTGDISTIKSDVRAISIKLDTMITQNSEYKCKVDSLEHDIIKIKQWCVAIAAFAGGGVGVLERIVLGN